MVFAKDLTESVTHDKSIYFLHADFDTQAGLWKKDEPIFAPDCKINLFLEGDFSVFIEGVPFDPMYGDICVFPPYTMHCGNVTRATHISYYQLDVGKNTLSGIPGGDRLMRALMERKKDEMIIRPGKEDAKRIIRLYEETERAIEKGNKPLAFSKTVEILSLTASVVSANAHTSVLSRKTADIVKYISENYAEDISADTLSGITGASKSYISRCFKKETGMSIHAYLIRYRLTKAAQALKTHTVTETAYLCGFSDESHFIASFKKCYGLTPLKYKNS